MNELFFMKKFILFIIAFYFTNICHSNVLDFNSDIAELYFNSTCSIYDYTVHDEEGILYKSFYFDVKEDGDYFISMWHCPVMGLGFPLPYLVELNDNQLKSYETSRTGWQGSYLNNGHQIHLKEGLNVLSITLNNFILPMVECIRISSDCNKAAFDGSNYQNYYENAKNGIIENHSISQLDLSSEIDSDALIVRNGLDLKYTFYTLLNLKKGDSISLRSSSSIDHDIDMFLIGYSPISKSATDKESDVIQQSNIVTKKKYYIPASIAITEKLNWHSSSEYLQGKVEDATIEASIPLDGVYMVRIKPSSSDYIGTANLTINNNMVYSDVPIYVRRIGVNIYQPNVKYEFLTTNNTNGDPLLFIESLRGNRIVAFDDDDRDGINALLKGEFSYAPFAFQVNNYSSLIPEGTCSVSVRSLSDTNDENMVVKSKGKSTITQLFNHQNEKIPNIDIRYVRDQGNFVTFKCDDIISEIQIISSDGYLINATTVNSRIFTQSVMDLKINTSGVYIIKCKVGNTWISKKVLITHD